MASTETDGWKASVPEVAKEFGEQLQAAEGALRRALDVLHDQEDRSEFFGPKHAEGLKKWAAEVADLAESVKRQV
jgi:hypothetical protein